MKITATNIINLLKSIGCVEEDKYLAIFPKSTTEAMKKEQNTIFFGLAYNGIYFKKLPHASAYVININNLNASFKEVEVINDMLVFDKELAINFG